MERIRVNAPGGGYNIVIVSGLLSRVYEYLGDERTIVVTDSTVAPLHGRKLVEALPHSALVTMSTGEQYKTLETVSQLYAELVTAGADRSTIVIALGGGVVGDTAGFVAATYMRGLRLVQIPTSLLAMVDSSVGGKVGVDLPQGKNLVGAFQQPHIVLIDPDVLQTLPPEQWRCGMAEIIKHGLIADPGLLDPALRSPDQITELIRRAVQVKVNIVEQDPFEQGIRAYLNLGHTFGHAVERVSNYSWLHGEAVGVGLLAAARLSRRLGMCGPDVVEQVDDILAETGLPRSINGMDPSALYAAMTTDKKWKAGHSRFVLLRNIGDPAIVEDVPEEEVLAVLESVR